MTSASVAPNIARVTASAPTIVKLRLIGQMEAWNANNESVLPPGRKTRALLAVVALSTPRPVLRGRLAELLWSRRPEEQARASLRQEIHRLLEVLGPAGSEILQTTRDHLALKASAVWVDVAELMRSSVNQQDALTLFVGDLLEGLDGVDPTFDAWLAAERERLRDRGRALAEAVLHEQQDQDQAISAAQRLLQIDRAHEGAWRALMRAHAERGERGMAIQAYDRCRAVLADLMDAAPSQETQRLLAAIRGPSGSRQLARTPAPPGAAASPPADHPGTAPPGGVSPAEATQPGSQRAGLLPARSGARIGVMPLKAVGISEEVAHLASGLPEEITIALAAFRSIIVVAPGSLARFATEARDEAAIRSVFGTDLLLDGTVQMVRDRLRVTVRLLDLRVANQVVWGRRFDRQSHDLLALQDEIAAEVVAQLDPEILQIEARRSLNQPPVTAYDLTMRAIPLLARMEQPQFMRAGAYLAEAIALEPDNAAAHAWYAYWHSFLVSQNWAKDRVASVLQAGQLAERAILLDPFDARLMTITGHVRTTLQHRPSEAAALHDRALTLNQNLAMAWALSAVTLAHLGDLTEAEARYQRYKRLSPLDPHAFFYDGGAVLSALLKHDHASAAARGRAVVEMNPSFSASFKPYLAALGHLGRRSEAAATLQRLLSVEPAFTVARYLYATPLMRERDRSHVAEGLRLAGVPEADPAPGDTSRPGH